MAKPTESEDPRNEKTSRNSPGGDGNPSNMASNMPVQGMACTGANTKIPMQQLTNSGRFCNFIDVTLIV